MPFQIQALPAEGFEVPEMLRTRLLAVRAFDGDGIMLHAAVIAGSSLEEAVWRQLADPAAAYVHVHNAREGCSLARVGRVAEVAFGSGLVCLVGREGLSGVVVTCGLSRVDLSVLGWGVLRIPLIRFAHEWGTPKERR